MWKPALLALGLASILMGCAAPTTAVEPTTIVEPTTDVGQTTGALSTPTIAPTSSAAPSPTPPAPTPAQGIAEENAPDRLVSQKTDLAPAIDGQEGDAWEAAEPLRLPLTWGMEGTEPALDTELRSLYTDQAVYFLAQWPDEAPNGPEDTVSNVLTVHWSIPDPMAQRLDCAVVCHTAYASGTGRLTYANTETVPQGGGKALDAAGGWNDGTWTLEWGRPLVNDNPYDLQFDDLESAYTFLVKVFKRVEGRPDPVSERHQLVFHP